MEDATDASPPVDAEPLPEHCVDIWVDASRFDEPARWRTAFGVGKSQLQFAAVDARGVHVATHVLEYAGNPQSFQGEFGDLAVLTFDRTTGDKTAERIYDVYPDIGYNPNQRWLIDFALAPDGTFATLLGWNGLLDPHPHFEVFVGHLDEPARQHRWPVAWDLPAYEDPERLDWDGEAFVLHGTGPEGWVMARVGLDGQPLLVRRTVGREASPGAGLSTAYATDPDTGWTLTVGPTGCCQHVTGALLLSGHDRLGDPLPGLPPEGRIIGPMTPSDWPEALPVDSKNSVAVTIQDGAIFLVGQFEPGGPVGGYVTSLTVRLDDDWLPEAWSEIGRPDATRRWMVSQLQLIPTQADERPTLMLQTLDGARRIAPALDRESVYVLLSDEWQMCGWDPDGRELRVPERQAACGERPAPWLTTGFRAATFEDEVWIAFVEQPGMLTPERHPDHRLRVVRAAPDCTYRSIRDTLGPADGSP